MNQENTYKKLFARLPEVQPSAGLEAAISGRIEHARLRSSRMHAALHITSIVAVCAAIVPAVRFFLDSAARSGFSEYLSLAWSDGGSVLGSWKTFLWSIMDSAPILETGIILALIVIFANSLRRGARYIGAIYAPVHHQAYQ